MATRKPLIVNPDVSQIQELPTGDSLDGITNLTATGTVQAEQLTSTDDATITGEITVSGQPTCLLTAPVVFTANGPIDGGDNNKPISFINETTNVNCTTSRSSNATDTTTGITSITVPSNGTYLVNALITGVNETSGTANDDQVILSLSKQDTTIASNIKGFPNVQTFPTFIFGNRQSEEFSASFSLPLTLSANDTLCIQLCHIDSSSAQIDGGYFSITKLH